MLGALKVKFAKFEPSAGTDDVAVKLPRIVDVWRVLLQVTVGAKQCGIDRVARDIGDLFQHAAATLSYGAVWIAIGLNCGGSPLVAQNALQVRRIRNSTGN